MKSQEFSRRALNLSLAVYRVTANFPIGEVLTRQLRLLANQITGDIVVGEATEVEKKINRLLVYFKIASQQNWVRSINWTVLSFEYIKLSQGLGLLGKNGREGEAAAGAEKVAKNISLMSHNIKREEKVVRVPASKIPDLSERQSMILSEINKRRSIKNADLAPLFKDVSARTLRTDLGVLLEKRLIRKEGANRTTVYLSK